MTDLNLSQRIMKPSEVAVHLRTSERSLERWRAAGCGPAYIRIGGRVFYIRSDLEAWELSVRCVPGRRS